VLRADSLRGEWTAVGPGGNGLATDGVRLFVSHRRSTGQTYESASLETVDGGTPYTSPEMTAGSPSMAYDLDHRVMYSANMGAGLYRVVTR
jgi:hypothetical protein